MGFFSKLFSSLFGGGAKKKEEVNDPNVQALKQFFKDKLPANYVNSPKYAISITRGDKGYEARINLDMGSDGSDYTGFGKDDFDNLSELESSYVFDEFIKDPPVTVTVIFDMDFGPKNKITVNKGRALAK